MSNNRPCEYVPGPKAELRQYVPGPKRTSPTLPAKYGPDSPSTRPNRTNPCSKYVLHPTPNRLHFHTQCPYGSANPAPPPPLTHPPHSMATTQTNTPNRTSKSPPRPATSSTPRNGASGDAEASIGSEDRSAANVARAKRRNREWLDVADASDRLVAGECHSSLSRGKGGGLEEKREGKRKHLTNEASDFFDKPAPGPDDAIATPEWFLEELGRIATADPPVPKKSKIVFENTPAAAATNESIFESFNFDMEKLIAANQDTTLGYGSEFRTVNQLKPLLGGHPNFNKLSKILNSGMSYNFITELDDLTKSEELRKLLQRGNHKSAQDCEEKVSQLLTKDVIHGFAIPIPVTTVVKITNAAVQPLGVARQWSIGERGERIEKFRMTQDLSFSSTRDGEPTSINDRIDMSSYTEMIFGWCPGSYTSSSRSETNSRLYLS